MEQKPARVAFIWILKFSKQCNEAAKKAMRVLGLVKRHFRNPDMATFRLLYKSFIRPHLEYSVQAWSPCLRRDIDCLEKVQRRATKLVQGFQNMCYEERLRRLGLTTLKKRCIRGDLIETFKIVTNRENIDSRQFFTEKACMNCAVTGTHCTSLDVIWVSVSISSVTGSSTVGTVCQMTLSVLHRWTVLSRWSTSV